MNKSLKAIAAKGTIKANVFLSNIAPANTAIPNRGVKFGGCGINLLKASIRINTTKDISLKLLEFIA